MFDFHSKNCMNLIRFLFGLPGKISLDIFRSCSQQAETLDCKNSPGVLSSACAELLLWRRHPLSVRFASVCHLLTQGFSETAAWIHAKLYGMVPIRHISRILFSFFKILNFQIFRILFFVFINTSLYGGSHGGI